MKHVFAEGSQTSTRSYVVMSSETFQPREKEIQ